MKKILVLYYTQSGQIKEILDSILSSFKPENIQIDYAQIQPEHDFPFPWQPVSKFYDTFPESAKGIAIPTKALNVNKPEQYDLVILGLQVWYLAPSLPIHSFLKSQEASEILRNKPVISVYGIRNMWVGAHKTVKQEILKNGGQLVGNIVLSDKHHNLVSVITIIRWLMKGKKASKSGKYDAGVSKADIKNAKKFGTPIINALHAQDFRPLQAELMKLGAVETNYHIMKLEQNGKRIFNIWANFILKKSSNKKRRKRLLKLFEYYLLFVIYAISPIASFFFILKKTFFPKKAQQEIIDSISLNNTK